MTKQELKNWINQNLWTNDKKQLASAKFVKNTNFYKTNKDIFDLIYKYTKFLDNVKLNERIYCILNDINEKLICNVCNKNFRTFYNINQGYRRTCSHKCSHNDEEYIERFLNSIHTVTENGKTIKENSTEKLIQTFNNKTVKEKQITNIKRSNSIKEAYIKRGDEIIEKKQNTCLERYSVDSYSKTDEFKALNSKPKRIKLKKPKLSKEEILQKRIKTNLDKYGVEHYQQTEKFKDSLKKCWSNKSKEEIKELTEKNKNIKLNNIDENGLNSYDRMVIKVKETCLERYGVDNIRKSPEFIEYSINKRIENGNILSMEDKSDIQIYKSFVSFYSNKNFRKYYYFINPKRLKRGRNDYHLDHNYSISEGFRNNIPIWIICHPCNLQMMDWNENISKNKKCNHTLEELLEKIEKFEKGVTK